MQRSGGIIEDCLAGCSGQLGLPIGLSEQGRCVKEGNLTWMILGPYVSWRWVERWGEENRCAHEITDCSSKICLLQRTQQAVFGISYWSFSCAFQTFITGLHLDWNVLHSDCAPLLSLHPLPSLSFMSISFTVLEIIPFSFLYSCYRGFIQVLSVFCLKAPRLF